MKQKLFRVENNQRIYKGDVSIENIFYSELNIHFLDYLNNNTKIYYLQFKPNFNIVLNSDELNYLFTLDYSHDESLGFFFSKTLKKIKLSQKDDLFFLTNLKNLDFLILLPQLTNDNKYYFNLIVGVTFNFDLNSFFDWKVKTCTIKNINEVNKFNLTEIYLSKIINVLNNKFRNDMISNSEFYLYKNCFTGPDNNINSKFTNKGRRIYKKIIFRKICFHFYWYNNSILKLDNTGFWIDWGYKDNVLVEKKNDKLNLIEIYHPSCLFDILLDSPEYICFQIWKLY